MVQTLLNEKTKWTVIYTLVAIIQYQGRKRGKDKGINRERKIKHKKVE